MAHFKLESHRSKRALSPNKLFRLSRKNEIHSCHILSFCRSSRLRKKQPLIKEFCEDQSVFGTIILAPEGINGTISGERKNIDAALDFLRKDKRLAKLPTRLSFTNRKTFHRMRVKLRSEIVTLGDPSVNPNEAVGLYVEPEDWNRLIEDPDVTLIDTRNDYEVAIGSFKGAVNPNTQSFRDFPEWVSEHLDPEKHT